MRLQLLQRERSEPWSRFLISPSPGYIETEAGPVALRKVEFIDIDPLEYRHTGRLTAPQFYDHTAAIQEFFEIIAVPYLFTDGCIRIRMQDIID